MWRSKIDDGRTGDGRLMYCTKCDTVKFLSVGPDETNPEKIYCITCQEPTEHRGLWCEKDWQDEEEEEKFIRKTLDKIRREEAER